MLLRLVKFIILAAATWFWCSFKHFYRSLQQHFIIFAFGWEFVLKPDLGALTKKLGFLLFWRL
ncbi:MAG: hypothetical protein EAZ69_22425 [Oscillatoriales cyanobacterium]|nr:MAG: hypothetical protein EAZ69_22425 [Oscillatoriales cyanobacterium]